MPFLTVPGVWKLVVVILALLALAAAFLHGRRLSLSRLVPFGAAADTLQTFLINSFTVARSSGDSKLARQICDTLGTLFAVELLRESRLRTRVELGKLDRKGA